MLDVAGIFNRIFQTSEFFPRPPRQGSPVREFSRAVAFDIVWLSVVLSYTWSAPTAATWKSRG